MARSLAAATSRPSRKPEFILTPSPVHAPPSNPSGGCVVRTTGRPWAAAKSQSRSSSAGTAMMAPVP